MANCMNESENKIDQLVRDSGLISHFKTIAVLKENGWEVLVSPYYYDSISESIREVDLIAEKQFSSDPYGPSTQLNVQLFIECKYIKPDAVFWFDKLDRRKALASFEKEISRDIVDGMTRNRLSGDLDASQLHYFQNDLVAKLFRDNHPNKREQIFSGAMNQCLHSLINNRRTGKKPIFLPFKNKTSTASIVQYPILVCDNFGNLSRVDFDENLKFKTSQLFDKFIIETNYREDYFLIDVIDIKHTVDFLNTIESEAKTILNSHY